MLSPPASPSAPGLTSFPPELLDYFSGFISNPSDLLSLALTNSTFRDIIIPFHLHYRTVRCSVGDSAMWNHLLENARRLQNVHSLELLPATPNRNKVLRVNSLPPTHRQAAIASTPDPSLPSSAIKRMLHLKSVAWRIWRFRSGLPQHEFHTFLEECWSAISQHCWDLEEVSASSSHHCCDCAPRDIGHQTPSQLFDLRRLTSFSCTLSCMELGHSYNPEPLFNFLAANPELRTLRLHVPSPRNPTQRINLGQLFQLRFPELRTLSLAGQTATIPHQFIDFLDAHPLLESIHFGQILFRPEGPTPPRPNMLPKLKHLATPSDKLTLCFFGELTEGTVRPLTSMRTYFSGEANQESNHSLSRVLKAIGEEVQALSVTFNICEPHINWVLVMTRIGLACPNLRRLDVRGRPMPLEPSGTISENVGNWIAPLHALRALELFNAPKGFFRHLVVRTGDKNQEIKFNHNIMLQLTHTCPSLRLINGALNQDRTHQDENLVYIRSARDPDKEVDLAKSRHTEEGLAIEVELLDQGQSTDYVWELYSVSSPASRDLWRVFLPHFDELRFANEIKY